MREPCHSRALESGLTLRLLDRTAARPERRRALIGFLETRRRAEDPIERGLATYALDGGPPADDADVERFLLGAPDFTSTRKRAFLDALLSVLGTAPNGAPPRETFALAGLHAWAAVQTTAVKVILADATGSYRLVSDSDVCRLLDTQSPTGVWEGHILVELLALHALCRLPGTAEDVRAGVDKVLVHQRSDGGIPFIPDEDNWCTATAGAALAMSHAPAGDVHRIAGYLVGQQQPAGGWSYRPGVRQTDVDTTSVALEVLQATGDRRYARAVRRGTQSLYAVRGDDGGFPTYLPGGPSEATMTAAALNALAAEAGRHDQATSAGLGFLVEQQRADGSFPPDWSKSRFHSMFRVLMAASRQPDRPGLRVRHLIDRGMHFVRSQQNTDGGWGQQAGDSSDPISTSYAVIAMCGQLDPGPAMRGVEYLVAGQRPDGSIRSPPDSLGPRPFAFRVPILADIVALLALGHLAARCEPGPHR